MNASSPDLATVIQFPKRPWWYSAPNPLCVDWCEARHDPGEFAEVEALVCQRIIVDDHRFVVRADAYLEPHEDGTPWALGARSFGPYVEVYAALSVEDGAELAAAILEANAFVRRAAELTA